MSRRNLLMAPLVILLRVPLMLPLWALIRLGELADSAYDYANEVLPAFTRT